MGFSGGSVSKESICNAGDMDLIPGLERSLRAGNGNQFQYSCLENPMVRGAWWATVPPQWGVRQWDMTQQQYFEETLLICRVWQHFSVNDQIAHVLGFADKMVSVVGVQPCRCSRKGAIDNHEQVSVLPKTGIISWWMFSQKTQPSQRSIGRRKDLLLIASKENIWGLSQSSVSWRNSKTGDVLS